ncbi:MAG: hypothetical protein DMF61_02910 [Blastocatellia bacterium AA13]|nr:MAG: hypothetical protein DMF61_02910 [Blastocatellia bacterium AA13]
MIRLRLIEKEPPSPVKRSALVPDWTRIASEAGFSIIELLIVTAFAAIIMTMTVMTFQKGLERYQLRGTAARMAWQIERARSIALKYNQTLTLGFTAQNTQFGLTCACPEAASELSNLSVSNNNSLSAYPTLTIKGNGTIQATAPTITIDDRKGRRISITINNAGRTVVGDITESTGSL